MEYRLKIGERVVSVRAERQAPQRLTLFYDNRVVEIDYCRMGAHHLHLVVNGAPVNAYLAEEGNGKAVVIRGTSYSIEDADLVDRRARGKKRDSVAQQTITPPMPAVVVSLLVSEGDRVKQGDPVLVVSAMKMETTLRAPHDGIVKAVQVAVGDKVMPGQVLVDIDRDANPGAA